MSTPIVIKAGGLVVFDPSDVRTVVFDWDNRNLGSTVEIGTNTFTITAITQSGATALAKDNEAKLTAAEATTAIGRTVSADNRATRVRLDATTSTIGDYYRVSNKIVTNESPTQTKEQSFFLRVQQR